MSDGFDRLVDEARSFFADLDTNNTKDWFEPRKDHYNAAIRKPAELLCDLVGAEITRLTGATHHGKVMRIYRDVRFSKDKRPYNAHLHMVWSQGAREDHAGPAWFFACAPDTLALNMGLPVLKGDALTAWRRLVDTGGDDLASTIRDTGFGLSAWGEPPLKKVPPPYPADHPQADLLRQRSFILDAALGEAWRAGGLLAAITDRCARLLPVWRVLAAAKQDDVT
ncbi:MAG: hypothetical protein B7Z31_02325 [Rhodobacterales bacterium 12-65-15]|nr:MAG: hypothetical protein B7Z31_02325 [Rhodobacterales bacterium 12-65-15]